MTGCQGELKNYELNVVIKTIDGRVLYDGKKTTYSNGFMGFWLPRNVEAIIELESEGKVGVYALSTFSDSPTCITTFQLK